MSDKKPDTAADEKKARDAWLDKAMSEGLRPLPLGAEKLRNAAAGTPPEEDPTK